MSRVVFMAMLAVMAHSAPAATVVFRVEPAALPDSAQVFIVGNHDLLGDWNPGRVPLTRQPDGAWVGSLQFPTGTFIEYKITLGAWDREALRGDGSVPPNSRHVVRGDATLVIPVPAWKQGTPPIPGGVTGTVHTYSAMAGEGLLPRDIHVWLPPGYDRSTEHYPVLYMHDGQQVFDPATASFGVDWQIDETATTLIGRGALRRLLVVAVNNTEDRYPEYSDTEQGAAYRRFLIGTVKPFVDRTYRTLPDRDHTAVMGSSMGGLASFLLAWYHPDVFSMAGCLSPAFFAPDLRKAAKEPPPGQPVRLYVDNGGIGLERWLQAGCDRMVDILQRKGLVVGENLVWFQDIRAEHNEAAWAKRAWRPLCFMFGMGEQEWTGGLPPIPAPVYAARDREPPRMVDRPPLLIAGIEASCTIHECGAHIEAILRDGLRLLENHRTSPEAEYVVVLDGPGVRARFTLTIGTVVTEGFPGGVLALTSLPPARCRVVLHPGGLDTLSETLDYLYTWWLGGSDAEIAGPAVIRLGRFPHEAASLELTLPLKAD